MFLALCGCAQQTRQARLKSEDDNERDRYQVRTIRDVASFDNTQPIEVFGVGLVTGLADTGGDPPPCDQRTLLEKQLAQMGVQNVKAVLARKDTSMVLVSARIPPGAHKGDLIDVEIVLPPNSKTTSLRGGHLEPCPLYNYEMTQNIAPHIARDNKATLGHRLVEAEGKLLVGLADGEEPVRIKQARIWGGGRCKIDRPFLLVLNNDKQFAIVAKQVADRINQIFHASFGGVPGGETAVARTKQYVVVKVPQQYRLNLPRFLRVVGLIPLRTGENGASGAIAEASRRYLSRLEEDVLDPATTVTAAIRLEALGEPARSCLKGGLKSPTTLVRFCCAEGLAYLGDPSCGKELGRLVVEQPALRAFSLTALASLDEAISQDTLLELLASPSAETRYGAFRALRALNEREPAVRGELLNDSFWLHQVAPGTPALVHITGARRAEIVLFGDDVVLKPPFTLQAGEFNVTAADEDQQCTLGRFMPRIHSAQHKQCSLKLEDVLRTLAAMGATYPEVVEVLRQARSCRCVQCSVESDALPQATSVYALQKAGERARARAEGQITDASEDDEEILKARLDLGATPTLFEKDDKTKIRTSEFSPPRQRKPKDQNRG
jgi:hypothetical protein